MNNKNNSSLLKTIENEILGREIKCTLNDGRITRGKLICLDRLKNMILADAVEERQILKSMYDADSNNIDVDSGGTCSGTSTRSGDGSGGKKERNVDDGDDAEGEEYFMFRRDISQVLIPGDQLLKVELYQTSMP